MQRGSATAVVHVWHDNPRAAVALATRVMRSRPGIHAIPVTRSVPRTARVLVAAAPDVNNAVPVAHALHLQAPQAVLVLALPTPDVTIATAAVLAGARAIVDLDAPDESLARGLDVVLADGAYVPGPLQAPVLAALARHRRDSARNRERIASLSSGERQVLELLGAGSDRAGIAQFLQIPPHRVRAIIDHARGKLGASTQRQAVALFRDEVIRRG